MDKQLYINMNGIEEIRDVDNDQLKIDLNKATSKLRDRELLNNKKQTAINDLSELVNLLITKGVINKAELPKSFQDILTSAPL